MIWVNARSRGRERREALLNAEGGVVSSTQLAELLGLSRRAVDRRRRKGELLALRSGGRAYRYPVWQLDDGKTLSGVEELLAALEDHDPWLKLSFFVRKHSRLQDARSLDILRDGSEAGLRRVFEAAKSYSEHRGD